MCHLRHKEELPYRFDCIGFVTLQLQRFHELEYTLQVISYGLNLAHEIAPVGFQLRRQLKKVCSFPDALSANEYCVLPFKGLSKCVRLDEIVINQIESLVLSYGLTKTDALQLMGEARRR